jgi:hypothetical protein
MRALGPRFVWCSVGWEESFLLRVMFNPFRNCNRTLLSVRIVLWKLLFVFHVWRAEIEEVSGE